jgi:hypothetical protein
MRRLEGEVLVYDLERHRAHCLNRAAALVFDHCDGETGVKEMARILRRELGAGPDAEWVQMALAQIRQAYLLEPAADRPAVASLDRRELLHRAGLGAALLLPLVTSVVAPSPAEAAATCLQQSACTNVNIGQPCYVTVPATECSIKTCQGPNLCL